MVNIEYSDDVALAAVLAVAVGAIIVATVAIAVAAAAATVIALVITIAIILVVANNITLIVNSDIEINIYRSTCYFYWFLYRILHSKRQKIEVAEISYVCTGIYIDYYGISYIRSAYNMDSFVAVMLSLLLLLLILLPAV